MRDKVHYVFIVMAMTIVAFVTDSAAIRWAAVVTGVAALVAMVAASVRRGRRSSSR